MPDIHLTIVCFTSAPETVAPPRSTPLIQRYQPSPRSADSVAMPFAHYGLIRTSAASRLPAKIVLPAGVITAAPGSETVPAASLNEPEGVAVTPLAIDVFAGARRNE